MRLRRDLAVVPVTALSFYENVAGVTYLLAGEDNLLKVYFLDPEATNSSTLDLSPGAILRCCLRIFEAQAVHGFYVTSSADSSVFTPRHTPNGHLLIWGAQDVMALPLFALEAAISDRLLETSHCLYPSVQAPDWIYDGVISPFDPLRGVLVLAHNEILPLRILPDGQIITGSVFSISRPILYSANLRWTDPNDVLVAAGTVFGEIIIWKFTYDPTAASSSTGDLLHVFTGHEGSIFGVQISETFESPTGHRRFLGSCSDDRTIRIWDISPTSRTGTSSISELHDARETGFGDSKEVAAKAPETMTTETRALPLAMAMGHLSRIWHVKFPATPLRMDAEGFVLPVYSFGEDTTVQRWLFEMPWITVGEKKMRELRHIGSYANHDGKHLWSTALLGTGPMPQIATGGADGKISIIEEVVGGVGEDAGNHMDVMVLQDDPSVSGLSTGGKDADNMRQYTFITDDCLVATTKSGKFIVGSFGNETQWTEVEASEETKRDLRTCTTIISAGPGKAVLGTSRGHVYGYSQEKGLQKLVTLKGKIMQLLSLKETGNSESETAEILFTVFNSPETRIVTIDFVLGSIVGESVLKGVDGRFVVTAAARVGSFLIIGSRKGFLNVLSATNNDYNFLLEIPPRAHDAVTSIVAIPGHTGSPTPCFLTTGRNGKYCIYRITPSTKSSIPTAELYHEVSLPFGPIVSTAWFASSKLIICGFRGTRLIVWNETRREQIASVDCGGAHRVFAHTSPGSPLTIRVAFTKASRVYVHSQVHPAVRSLKKGIHGREIRTVAGVAGGRYLASGSEDTTIRVWEVISGQELCVAAQLSTHVSGLQSLRWAANDWLFSSSGNEEFFVWRVRELGAGMEGLAVMFVESLPEKSKEGDLRIMDFDVQVVVEGAGVETEFRIQMAYSNSEVKTYRYLPTRGWKLLAKGRFTGACLLHVKELRRSGETVLPPVLTASTDGHLCIWEVQSEVLGDKPIEYKMTLATTAHQNSPKAFDIRYFKTESSHGYLVATGGDDNAVALVRYIAAPPGSTSAYIVTRKYTVRSAHTAAINGLAIAKAEASSDDCLFVSASNDQKVKFWRATGVVGGDVGIELLDDQYSGVSDAGSVEAVDGGFVVSGVGMEMWMVETGEV